MPSDHIKPVYEVVAGAPTWGRLYRLATEAMASLALRTIKVAVSNKGQNPKKANIVEKLRSYLGSELPTTILRDVLDVSLSQDRFRCHHNPTECVALELWRVFYHDKFTDVQISHHAFAFPKTTNYPDIVTNVETLLEMLKTAKPWDEISEEPLVPLGLGEPPSKMLRNTSPAQSSATQTMSFKLELKQCEVGCVLQDKLVDCLSNLGVRGTYLRSLELLGLGSDELLEVIAKNCNNLEILNIKGSREAVTDRGFSRYVNQASPEAKANLMQLNISRCMLTQVTLTHLQNLNGLKDLRFCTRLLDDINYSSDGSSVVQNEAGEVFGLERVALDHVESVTVEHENQVQVSINKVMSYLKHVFPAARKVALTNCIACELHVTLTQQPTNITYMRQHIHTLELISADYFIFPRLVYPCPNLESLHIEKPTNDIFNIDAQNVPFLYGNTVPFINLKHLKLSRISLTNLSHFLSKSSNLTRFKVTNIGRRERPRWSDERIRQILSPESVPNLEEFHVSCLPQEGYSSAPSESSHRFLQLTQSTVHYLTENFKNLKCISGIESWNPKDTGRDSISTLLNQSDCKFAVISL